ncbi:conserved hypothetical protein [Ketogulonicigenium vulgare Y25]|nr:conserved hypothetical protein [Ketogulonicigenium vulgare Y25]
MSASWSVITVMRNTPYEVMRFVAWYLDMGADQIYIIFHDENDPFIARLQGHPRITCIPFTAVSFSPPICVHRWGLIPITLARRKYRPAPIFIRA